MPTPEYYFNTKKHVKIWFSADPTIFMNVVNQLRLIRLTELHRRDPYFSLSVIYSSKLLSDSANEQLEKFAKRHFIDFIDFDTSLQAMCDSEKDAVVYGLAKMEIEKTKEDGSGNFAAASDHVRLLEPVLELGSYSDFDTQINVLGLPPVVKVETPILIPGPDICINDILGVATNPSGQLHPDAKNALNRIKGIAIAAYCNLHDRIRLINSKHNRKNLIAVLGPRSLDSTSDRSLLREFIDTNPRCSLFDIRAFLLCDQGDIYYLERKNLFYYLRNLQHEIYVNLNQRLYENLNRELYEKFKAALLDINTKNFPDNFDHNEKRAIYKIVALYLKDNFEIDWGEIKEPSDADFSGEHNQEYYDALIKKFIFSNISHLVDTYMDTVTLFSGPRLIYEYFKSMVVEKYSHAPDEYKKMTKKERDDIYLLMKHSASFYSNGLGDHYLSLQEPRSSVFYRDSSWEPAGQHIFDQATFYPQETVLFLQRLFREKMSARKKHTSPESGVDLAKLKT